MPRSLEAKLSEGAKRAGKKKSEFVRDCVVKELIRLGVEVLPEDLESKQGARNDLPNRITEAEKRSRKGVRGRGRPRKEEARLIKRAKKEVAKLALAFGKAKSRAEARSLADAAVKPPHPEK